jgi:hypothetical protein
MVSFSPLRRKLPKIIPILNLETFLSIEPVFMYVAFILTSRLFNDMKPMLTLSWLCQISTGISSVTWEPV